MWIEILIALILGLGWGSFATMAIYRLPRGMPWIGDKPRCFSCKTPLSLRDYFSIISYFIHKGECRHCGAKFENNISYFYTETGITILCVVAYLCVGFGSDYLLLTALGINAIVIAVIDAEHQRIPAKPLLSLLILGIIWRCLADAHIYGIIFSGMTVGLLATMLRVAYFKFKSMPGIGWDFTQWQHEDRFAGPGFEYVKLCAIIGIWLQPQMLLAFFPIIALVLLLWRVIRSTSLRVGSILSMALLIAVMWPWISPLLPL